jgi:hypothetical protein
VLAKRIDESKTTIKKTSAVKVREGHASKDLRSEYRFDYANARPSRFARRTGAKSVVVLLALRAIMKAVPRRKAAVSSN